MADLAIKGHKTRGKEVIALLEMLGGINKEEHNGENNRLWYSIDERNEISFFTHAFDLNDYKFFTLEEFLEKFPYKVGDKVCFSDNPHHYLTIMEIWWNDDCSDLECTFYEDNINVSVSDLHPYKEETMKVSEEFFDKYCKKCGSQRCTAEGEWLEECKHYKEETMEETKKNLDWHPTDYLEFVDNDEWADEVELNLGNSYEIQVRDGQTFAIKKQPQYPKTCEECLKILGKTMNSLDNMRGYKYDLFMRLQQLLISREAYWKIAGEQMGLGKPWELSIGTPIYYIYYNRTYNIIKKDNADDIQGNIILAFPTVEMRDAFYENFKELIEQCKELL